MLFARKAAILAVLQCNRCPIRVNSRRRHSSAPARPIGEVRIIGGSLKRSKLPVPDRPGLRPTPDRVRETLFNWLGSDIEGIRALDLCAGTGVLGLEALSRGAAFVHFNEADATLAGQIEAALERFHMSPRATVTRSRAERMLASTPADRFELVFVDPPYQAGLWPEILRLLPNWLTANARIYLEHPSDQPIVIDDQWLVIKQSRAGRISYLLLERSRGSASLSTQTPTEPSA